MLLSASHKFYSNYGFTKTTTLTRANISVP